jgi:hypothetical protein
MYRLVIQGHIYKQAVIMPGAFNIARTYTISWAVTKNSEFGLQEYICDYSKNDKPGAIYKLEKGNNTSAFAKTGCTH